MSTKLTLLTGTFALVVIADFKNLLGQSVGVPAGKPSLIPADAQIATVAETPAGFKVTAAALGKTTLAYNLGPVAAAIDVEVIDPSTPVSVEFTLGPVTPVPAPVAEAPSAAPVSEGPVTEPPVADSTAQPNAEATGM